jgi:hypothetical protein
VWEELFESFLDRRAAWRFRHHAESYADYRWKPRLALVLPASFALARATHRRDLATALEVLAAPMEHYNLAVVSDSPDALWLFHGVVPFSAEAIKECSGALVVGSRSLNDQVGAVRPSRYVTADPCAHRINKKRIVFTAAGPDACLDAPAADEDVARDARGALAVFVDEDDETPAFLEALGRLRALGVALRITLSARADEVFARRVQAAFADDPRATVHDAGPHSEDTWSVQLSNEPIALLAQPAPPLPRYLFRRDRFWRIGSQPSRSECFLYRGEEADAHGVLAKWLGRPVRTSPLSTVGPSSPACPLGKAGLAGVRAPLDPLVSIVVPIYDRAAEILRMAHSIYAQDYPWIEVVFVSNGSPPETLEAMRVAENYLMKRRFRVRTLELARACGSATVPRDLGIRASTGDAICVLDSDDWLEPGFLGFLHDGWRDDTVYYPKKVFRNHGRSMREDFPWDQPLGGLGAIEAGDFVEALRRHGNFLCNSGVCLPRRLFDCGGGIDHRLRYGEDLYLWWRCARAGGRAQEHDGRVSISLHPGNNELVVGEDARLRQAQEMATGQELTGWL